MDLGLDLSFGYLMSSMLVSSVGFSLFLFGKKQMRGPQLVVGVVLMALPMVVGNPWYMIGLSSAIVAAMWFGLRAAA